METRDEGQSLTAEDQLFILMQAGLYLTTTRGLASPEARICYERAEPLCHSLNRPHLLYVALIGQWRYSLLTDKLSATMQIAEASLLAGAGAERRGTHGRSLSGFGKHAATIWAISRPRDNTRYGVLRSGAQETCSLPRKSSTRLSLLVCAMRPYPSGI